METLSSTTPRGGNCQKVCRGKGCRPSYPMIRSVFAFFFFHSDDINFCPSQQFVTYVYL